MADKSKHKHRVRTRWDSMVSLNPRVPSSDKPHSVKQEFASEVNINSIMAKARNGISPPAWMTSKTPMYGDFANQPSTFMEAFAVVDRAKESFYALPVEFRRDLGHDPRNLVNAPRELFEKYGLLRESAKAVSEAPGRPVASPEGTQVPTPASSVKNARTADSGRLKASDKDAPGSGEPG